MSSLKDCIREVRNAAAEQLEARHRDGDASTDAVAAQPIPRDEALATIALVTIRLLEQQLQGHTASDEASAAAHRELQAHLKACRKALKAHRSAEAHQGSSSANTAASLKRSRPDKDTEGEATAASSSAAAAGSGEKAKVVELGQYASSDAFDKNEEKRLKFARLMGGAKAAAAAAGGAGSAGGSASHPHQHNTHAKSSAEVRRMNENLEREFESAMTHKGKKGLGA